MASQGAGFAFDMSNIDFGTSFMMSQQQQQPASKPIEGNTSTDFFFGDEGIDTSGSFCIDTLDPTVLSMPQEQTYMSQNLTMDNTLANTSMTTWDDQLASNMFNPMPTFMPLTPVESFDSIYSQQPQVGTTLGKRPLQLDVHDFPVAKRHESLGEYTTITPLHSSAATTTNWALETQPTPSSSVVVGLSDEAADVCTMWFNKYSVLPSDKHIESLSQLTGESADAIRNWFGRLIKEGMGMGDSHGSDSAYRSQTASNQQEQFWNDQLCIEPVPQTQPAIQQQQEVTTTSEVTYSHDTTTTSPSATTLRSSKKRCTPTNDPELLGRDPNKIYQCTRKCGKRYGRKCDWKRNEEEGYPCKSWVCSLCISEDVQNVKPCFRKYHFSQHFRNIHPGLNADDYDESSVVCSETGFPRRCGFCRHRFDSRQERIDHIADHFKQGKCMLDWNDDHSDDGEDSEDNNDDNRPSGDDFDDGKPSYQPPGNDSRGGSNSKYYGGGDYSGGGGGGSDGGAPQGGFFQFQLSQLSQLSQLDDNEGEGQCSTQRTIISDLQPTEHCQPNPKRGLNSGKPDSCDSCALRKQHESSERHCADALARDVISSIIIEDPRPHPVPKVIRSPSGVIEDPTSAATLSTSEICLHQTPPQSISTVTAQDNHISDGFKILARDGCSFLSLKLLGAGGFSTVDEVIHRETNLRISRKTLKNRDPSAIEELQKEVNVLKKLRHPHIIRFLGSYSKGDKMSILLSPVAETNLALWLNQVAVQKPADLFNMISKMSGCLASSVRYLHEQRPAISHGDIKPQNILVMQGDQGFPHVVLSDFGTSSSDGLDKEQFKPLTRQYIAPEVLEGFPRKEAADIWSLGCVFLEMICCALGQRDAKWLKERAGKCYWQDVLGLQDGLSDLLLQAPTVTAEAAIRIVKAMLSLKPHQRPSAALLSLNFTPDSCCLNWANENAIFPAPGEELLAAEKISREDGIDCRTHAHSNGNNANTHGQDAFANTHGQDAFANVNYWLEECSHSHEACRQPGLSHAKPLPTRLVDVRPAGKDGTHVRVINSAAIESRHGPIEYVALSHIQARWFVFLQSTAFLEKQQADFCRDNLPKSCEQAIQAAQRLGYRYIWDDSLCILQDCEDDKRKECANMASVFRNAALTIVLDQLDEHNALAHDPLVTSKSEPQAVTTQRPVVDLSSWNTRAWSLQDRLLSRRLLHLGTQQMYWECNAVKASETFPRGLPPLVWEKVHTKASGSKVLAVLPDDCRREALHGVQSQPCAVRQVQTAKPHVDAKCQCHARCAARDVKVEEQQELVSGNLPGGCRNHRGKNISCCSG